MKLIKKSIPICFKGNRTYLHGSDMYNAVNALAPEISKDKSAYLSEIAFHRFARHYCQVWNKEPAFNDRLVADGLIVFGKKGVQKVWIIETDQPVKSRYSIDENSLIKSAIINDKRITLSDRSQYTPIEEIIALTKTIDYALLPPNQGKWFLGKLKLHRPLLNHYSSIKIVFKSSIAQRFNVHDIFQDTILMGEIFFILGEL